MTHTPGTPATDYDVVVVGSGFGGSVTALRLREKGYRVAVFEAGRRFTPTDFPKTSWRMRRFLWAPPLGCTGLQRVDLLNDVMVMSGAGVGGGSLVYANTLYRPLAPFYKDPQWGHITDWAEELAPFYDQAERMLGVTQYGEQTPSDEVVEHVAKEMGAGDTFHYARLGVYLGEPGVETEDPFFGGAGPRRTGCLRCGECMTGCRHGAKNTLETNYLYLAERMGAEVHPLTTVKRVRPMPGGAYQVTLEPTPTGPISALRNRLFRDDIQRTITTGQVVFAAGTLGTQRLLHAMRDEGELPGISPRLGELTRTNCEALLGAVADNVKVDYSRGPAITSSFHPDESTHIEVVRYGKGSNSMSLLATLLVDGGGKVPRWVRYLGTIARHPVRFLRSFSARRWSERTVILLVMQSLNTSLTVFRKKGWFGHKLSSRKAGGEPTWIPAGHDAARLTAERIDGTAGGTLGDVFNIPMTAHILGGAPIGDSPETGVVDAFQRVYGHPGLHVADGAAVCANLGVNPSLTITAQAERAMAYWPNLGEPDPRPPLGAPYRRIDYVPPRAPAVPARAPGALRLTVLPGPERAL
ncbi:MAG: FAD-dependent oxidoreductase [Streptosporangiales bacterium]|nr:FAD-dependent oxidoreductase [Streptosporangiales bacterium]